MLYSNLLLFAIIDIHPFITQLPITLIVESYFTSYL